MNFDLVKNIVFTEKSFRLVEDFQYTFDVDLKLTKPQIKKLIEELFNAVVVSVNTHRPPRKKKRVGLSKGFKTSYKRVIVTMKGSKKIQTVKPKIKNNFQHTLMQILSQKQQKTNNKEY